MGHVRRVLGEADAEWAKERSASGLVSGEGLIWNVRDRVTREKKVKDKKRGEDVVEQEVVDPGVGDKRLLVYESEFASVLRVMSRDGNTLSPTVRAAWDGNKLQTLAKNVPAVATGAHISMIAHITLEELRKELRETEAANGFANRFLFCCVRRTRLLPEGGNIDPLDLKPWIERLPAALKDARFHPLARRFDDEARELWAQEYAELAKGAPGLLGSVTARAEAQVRRLALLYALVDCSKAIEARHLQAALSVWDYCEASAS